MIKTDDLDVNQPKETNREYAVPGQIKRDTAAIAGGKQVQYKLSKKCLCIRVQKRVQKRVQGDKQRIGCPR